MLTSVAVLLATQVPAWTPGPPLPRPVSNTAVATVETARGWEVYAFLGLDSTKRWDGVVNLAFRWRLGEKAWDEIRPVPGPGRLAATAQSVRGRVYVFGGYTVAADGTERTLPNVDIWDPGTETWSAGAAIPVPTDDAVSGVWRDSLVYLISGWHDRDNIRNVQIYDPTRDRWLQATPIPGPPVFGHAGGIAGDAIVYVDGVRVDRNPRRFAAERSAWRGDIDPSDPTRITWRRIADHPGPTRYRAGGGADGTTVLIAGGTANPYNYDGIGYNGVASQPVTGVLQYDVAQDEWESLPPLSVGVMDLRAVVRAHTRWILVGGMTTNQEVTAEVWMRETHAR